MPRLWEREVYLSSSPQPGPAPLAGHISGRANLVLRHGPVAVEVVAHHDPYCIRPFLNDFHQLMVVDVALRQLAIGVGIDAKEIDAKVSR